MSIEDDIAVQDAREDGVYLVQIFDKETFIRQAIFSTLQKSKDWINTQPRHYTCMASPFVVDMPDDMDKEKMN